MKQVLIFTFILSSLIFSGCSFSDKEQLSSFQGEVMGTTYTVKITKPISRQRKEKLGKEIFNSLESVNKSMSTYKKDSELSKLNQYKGEWFTLSPEVFEVISYAMDLAEVTEGAYDITAGPLVNLWGFGPKGEKKVPSRGKLFDTRQHVGYKNFRVNKELKSVRKETPKMYIDLSSIAKGYAVDKLANYLKKKNYKNFFIEVGGEIRTAGKKGIKDWMVGVERPSTGEQQVQTAIPLKNMAIATSGNYRNFFEDNGSKYGHTIDPRTGKPVEHQTLSVSVIAKTCMEADAWATALMVLGQEKGLEKALENNIEAYFIYVKDGKTEVIGTEGFMKRIK